MICAFSPPREPDVNLRVRLKVQGASEITANLYCNCEYLYWEGCVICSVYLRYYMERLVPLRAAEKNAFKDIFSEQISKAFAS